MTEKKKRSDKRRIKKLVDHIDGAYTKINHLSLLLENVLSEGKPVLTDEEEAELIDGLISARGDLDDAWSLANE